MITDDQAKALVSANITRLLAARGWKQRDLAEATGENDMTISRIVRGSNVPGVGLISRIADALNVSVDELLSRKKQNRRNAS